MLELVRTGSLPSFDSGSHQELGTIVKFNYRAVDGPVLHQRHITAAIQQCHAKSLSTQKETGRITAAVSYLQILWGEEAIQVPVIRQRQYRLLIDSDR